MKRKQHKYGVMLATPVGKDNRIDIETSAICGKWARRDWVDWDWESSYTAEFARNIMIYRSCPHKVYTHILFVDCDTIPQESTLDKLLSREADIASGIYPIYSGNPPKKAAAISIEPPPKQTLMDWDKAKSLTKPFEAEAAGGGCLLVKMDVLRAMKWPWFATVYHLAGIVTGHDFRFCNKVREAGFKIIVDPTVVCRHFRPQELSEIF